MNKVSKYEFVKQLESLLRQTSEYQHIHLKYGYIEDCNLIESKRDLTKPNDPREMVEISFENSKISYILSVEMDSHFAIVMDVLDYLRKIK